MKAMVLAAGFGTRLKAITETLPKCLVEVAGKTMLEHVVDRLKVAGVSEIVINLHYRGEQIREYVVAKKSFGIKIDFSIEPEILGTGGGIKNAAYYFTGTEPFIVHNSDVYSNLDLQAMIEAHRNAGALATLAVIERPTSRVLLFDEENNLFGYENRKENNRSVVREVRQETAAGFSGIHICSPELFQFMESEQGSFSIVTTYLNAVRAGKKVHAYRMDGAYWIDMGTPEKLEELRRHLVEKQ